MNQCVRQNLKFKMNILSASSYVMKITRKFLMNTYRTGEKNSIKNGVHTQWMITNNVDFLPYHYN